MQVSSRTPEGEPNTCKVCGRRFVLESSAPPGDAPCPYCGSLAWFELAAVSLPQDAAEYFVRNLAHPAAFRQIRPSTTSLPVVVNLPQPEVRTGIYQIGQIARPIVYRWSWRRRRRDRERLERLLRDAVSCTSREDLQSLIGEPQLLLIDDGGFRNEFYQTTVGNVALRFANGRLVAMFGMIPFSSLEWGAGLAPDNCWHELIPGRGKLRRAAANSP